MTCSSFAHLSLLYYSIHLRVSMHMDFILHMPHGLSVSKSKKSNFQERQRRDDSPYSAHMYAPVLLTEQARRKTTQLSFCTLYNMIKSSIVHSLSDCSYQVAVVASRRKKGRARPIQGRGETQQGKAWSIQFLCNCTYDQVCLDYNRPDSYPPTPPDPADVFFALTLHHLALYFLQWWPSLVSSGWYLKSWWMMKEVEWDGNNIREMETCSCVFMSKGKQ